MGSRHASNVDDKLEKIYEGFAALPLNTLRMLYCVGKSVYELVDENNSIKMYLQKGLSLLNFYSERNNIKLYSNVLRELTKEIVENYFIAYEVDYETIRSPNIHYNDLNHILEAIRKKVSKQPTFKGIEGIDSDEDIQENYNDYVDDQKKYNPTASKSQHVDEEKNTEISEDKGKYIEYNEEEESLQLYFILDRIVSEVVAESLCKNNPKTCYQFAITTYLCGDPDF